MHAWFVVYMPQFVVTVHVVAVHPQPVCKPHALICVNALHVVAVPVQPAIAPSPVLPSTPPSSTIEHAIVAPGARQNPSPSHVKPPGQSSGPRHEVTRQSSNDALYEQPAVAIAATRSNLTTRHSS
jgi:hypothetical protein